MLERPLAGGGQPKLRAWLPVSKRLGAKDVTGIFQLARVHAEITIRGVEQMLELIERQRFVGRERTHDSEAYALVNECIERHRGRLALACAQLARRCCIRALL